MKATPSSQKQLEAATAEKKALKIIGKSIQRDALYPHTESSIYVEEPEELCFVLSSN